MTTNPSPKRNAPAATEASMHTGKAIQMLRKHISSPGVTDTLDQLRTTISDRDMWELSELRPYVAPSCSKDYYFDVAAAAVDEAGRENIHFLGADEYVTRKILQLVSEALDAPQEVQDYFAPPKPSIRERLALVADSADDQSPFDRIRQVREDGTEFWSARDLMPLLGYDQRNAWQKFEVPLRRAMSAAANQGTEVENLFIRLDEKTGGRPRENFELTRFAAYLVAMNGDPNKPEVAAAQAYFAVKTREAETQTSLPLSEEEIVAQALQITTRKVEELETKVQELTPKAEFYDELMEADGSYSFGATARILGFGRNIMMRELRRLGVLQSNNLPYRRYDHHFQVTPGTYTNPKTGEVVPTATTTVLPTGLPFLRRKLEGVEV